MSWIKLVDYREDRLWMGTIFRFHANYPFDGTIVMMLHLSDWEYMIVRLITIAGYRAGAFSIAYLPFHADYVEENGNIGVSTQWLIDNWNTDLFEETDVNEIWIKTSLEVDDIQPTSIRPSLDRPRLKLF
jgi:hypothetical protein